MWDFEDSVEVSKSWLSMIKKLVISDAKMLPRKTTLMRSGLKEVVSL